MTAPVRPPESLTEPPTPLTYPGSSSTAEVPTSLASGLTCEVCGAAGPLEVAAACGQCLGALDVAYDLGPLVGSDPVALLGRRPRTLWRFRELLPPIDRAVEEGLAVESSPLRRARRLGELLGLDDLWIKDDSVLPSGSFKDRPASVAVATGLGRGFTAFGCASTGNLAAATARSAARVGSPCLTVVPRGLPAAKLAPARRYGARIVEVRGTYDDANRIASLVGERLPIGFVNVTLRPYYAEGSKTVLLEVLEQLSWTPPEAVIVPLGSGALLAATARAERQVTSLGWLDRSPGGGLRLIGSQPEGCTPIVDAFHRGADRTEPVQTPTTIAESLAIGDPASGPAALRAIRRSGGVADAPSAGEVTDAIRAACHREGLWVEPAGGTVIATARRLRASGVLSRSDRVVLFLTGAGWKVPDVGIEAESSLPSLVLDPRRFDADEIARWLNGRDDAPGEARAW